MPTAKFDRFGLPSSLDALTPNAGVGWSQAQLDAFMASQTDGLFFDFTKTDRHFQEGAGSTLADDVGEAMGLAMDQRSWSGQTLAQIIAAAPELVTNGNFLSAGSWTVDGGWAITGGALVATNAGAFTYNPQNIALVADTWYRVSFDITEYTSGSVRMEFGGGTQVTGTARSAIGTYVEYFKANTGNIRVGVQATTASCTLKVDNVSVKAVPGKHGTQTNGTLKGIRQTSGCKYDGGDDNHLVTYVPASAENFLVARVVVPAVITGTQIVAGSFNGTTQRFWLGFNTNGQCGAGVGSDSISTIFGTTDCRGQEVVVCVTCDAAGLRLFVNNAEEFASARNGVLPTAVPWRIGSQNNAGSAGNWFGGGVKKLLGGREYLTLSKFQQMRPALLAA